MMLHRQREPRATTGEGGLAGRTRVSLRRVGIAALASIFTAASGWGLICARNTAYQQVRHGERPFVPAEIYQHLGNVGSTAMALGTLALMAAIVRCRPQAEDAMLPTWERPLAVGAILAGVGTALNLVAELDPVLLKGISQPGAAVEGDWPDFTTGLATSLTVGVAMALPYRGGKHDAEGSAPLPPVAPTPPAVQAGCAEANPLPR